MSNFKQIYRNTAEFLKTHEWTQGAIARTVSGYAVSADVSEAIRWCAYGAMQMAAGKDWGKIRKKILDRADQVSWEMHGKRLADWNDMDGRTKEEVISFFTHLSQL